MVAWILVIWLGLGLIGAALYLWEAARVEILPFDLFMAGALVLFGPVSLLRD